MANVTEAAAKPDKWSPRVWHRRASKPVSVWMMVFIATGLVHFLIPNYRWVLVHMFTLGVLTNSIVVWSQHLTEKFVQQRLPDAARPRQLYRIWALNAGAVVTIGGNMFQYAPVTIAGATIVAAVMLRHAFSLLAQWRTARGKRFRAIVLAYAVSAASLPLGAFFGGWLALRPGDPQLLLAHIACNVAGFVGLAAAGSLTVLFPALWRTKGTHPHVNSMLALLVAGVVFTAGGALAGFPQVGLVMYVCGWALGLSHWLRDVDMERVTFPALSALCALFWLVLGLAYYTAASFVTPEPARPTLPLLVGFAAQLLIGVMAYLLPTTMGGGPGAVRAGLNAMGRFGLLRLTFLNGGLALWVSGASSWHNVAMSLLALGSLAVAPIFIARGVKAQRAVLQGLADAPARLTADLREVPVGAAILIAVWVAFHL